MAQDRIGIKPLYYYWDGKTLLFASEIKAILEDTGVLRVVEPTALDDFLTYMSIPAPKTIFKNIYKLRAGHFLKASAGEFKHESIGISIFRPTAEAMRTSTPAGFSNSSRNLCGCIW